MRKRLICTALIVALCLTTACGSAASSGAAPSKETGAASASQGQPTATNQQETLTVALSQDISTTDPAANNDTATSYVTNMMTNRLFYFDSEMNLINDLAESYEYLDGTTLQVKLKQGVLFHDGSELKAEDVKASIERAVQSSMVGYVVGKVSSVDVVDDYTVNIITSEVFAPLLSNLVHPGCSILSKKQIDSGNFDTINGTGPYKFVSWQSGNEIVLERNEDYFDPARAGGFAKMVFRIIPEPATQTIALESGDVDIIPALDKVDYTRVKDNANLDVVEMNANHVYYLALNTEAAPFDNKLVRQAMNYAIDKAGILEVAEMGYGRVLNSYTPPNVLGAVEGDYEYDPEKAKQLFSEAGYDDLTQLSITINSFGNERVSPVIQANLTDLGINVQVGNMDRGPYYEMMYAGDFQCGLTGWTTSSDPDRFFAGLIHSRSIGANNMRFNNPQADSLIERGTATVDEAERAKIYTELNELLLDECPWVPLYSKVLTIGVRGSFTCDGIVDPVGNMYLNMVRQ